MKNFLLRLLAFAIALGTSVPASAQFSSQLSGLAGLSGEAGFKGNIRDIDAELKAFIDESAENNRQAFNALRAIRIAYEDAEGAARETAITRSVNAMIDPEVQKTRMEQIKKSDLAALERWKNSSDAVDGTRNLGPDRQRQVVTATDSFLAAADRAADLIKRGQSIIRYVSLGRMNMATVAPVKEAMPALTDTRTAASKLFPEFIKVLKDANLQVPQVAANPE